jgi:hypothetical protein
MFHDIEAASADVTSDTEMTKIESNNTPRASAMSRLLGIWPSWLEAIVVREVMSSSSEEMADQANATRAPTRPR